MPNPSPNEYLDQSIHPDGNLQMHEVKSHSRVVAGAAQGLIATTEVYLTGSAIKIPPAGMALGQVYQWFVSATKTAAGTAAPVWKAYIGTTGSISDTARISVTGGPQTAALWDGILTFAVVPTVVSASGVIYGSGGSYYGASQAAGFGIGGAGISATFDNTALGGQFIGLTVTSGASAAWTINGCTGVLLG
jgi:hypothetical protein